MTKRPEPFEELDGDDYPGGTLPDLPEDEEEDICPDCLEPESWCVCEDEDEIEEEEFDDDFDEDYEDFEDEEEEEFFQTESIWDTEDD